MCSALLAEHASRKRFGRVETSGKENSVRGILSLVVVEACGEAALFDKSDFLILILRGFPSSSFGASGRACCGSFIFSLRAGEFACASMVCLFVVTPLVGVCAVQCSGGGGPPGNGCGVPGAALPLLPLTRTGLQCNHSPAHRGGCCNASTAEQTR